MMMAALAHTDTRGIAQSVRRRVAVSVLTSPESAFFTTTSTVLPSAPWRSMVICLRSRPLHSFPPRLSRMSPDATSWLFSAQPPSLILLIFQSLVDDCLNVKPSEHFCCLEDDMLVTDTASSSLAPAAPVSGVRSGPGAAGSAGAAVSLRWRRTMKVSSEGLRWTASSQTDPISPVSFSEKAITPRSTHETPSTVCTMSLGRRRPLSVAAPPSLSLETSNKPLDRRLNVKPSPPSFPFSLWIFRFPTRLCLSFSSFSAAFLSWFSCSCAFFMNSSSACLRC
mmetsp:Transcript_36862/g.86746  ORF Transcript_36862/g.86746 Transcript_36862/m.86746 type:complete len:281 (+) Transcript_36862:219-1061(+)